jgi:MoaA/NifB/PqqE/SkfB family radical SAM enzyme
VLLERSAAEVAAHFERVIVSLDAPTETLYQTIRGVAALRTIERGVAAVRRIAPHVPITARATLHRLNYRELPRLVEHAKAMAVDGISFLAADVSSSAFGRSAPTRAPSLTLAAADVDEFAEIVEAAIDDLADDFRSGFIAEPPGKLRRLPQYYAALLGRRPFPPVSCNAPYTSIVVEADGAVRPCFFHEAIGNVRLAPLPSIVARNLATFRQSLDMASNPICRRCVCSMKTGWRSAPWQ